jgi:uncharacterized membrane protein YhaH (DUF805 family)
MSLTHFFLSFRGRISRQAWWLGFLFLFAVTILLTRFIDPHSLLSNDVTRPGPVDTILSLLLCWPTAAITTKRFNDRDWPDWAGPAVGTLYAVYVIANWAGFFLDPESMGKAEELAFAGFVLVFFSTLLDNAFVRGTPGPNRHGPDPVGLTTAFGDP